MLFSGMWPDAESSLEFYGAMRTSNRQGVTIPSQRRYVRYFGDAMRRLRLVETKLAAPAAKVRPTLPPKDPAIAAQFAAEMAAAQEKIYATLTAFLPPADRDDASTTTAASAAATATTTTTTTTSTAAAAATTTTTTATATATTTTSANAASAPVKQRRATVFEAPKLDLVRRRELWLKHVYQLEPLELLSLTLSPAPLGVAMRDLRFVIAKNKNPLLTWQPEDAEGLGEGAQRVDLDCGRLRVAGDIKVTFFVREQKNKLLHFWINTSFVRSTKLVLFQPDIDDAHKDKGKQFGPDFRIELRFNAKAPTPAAAAAAAAASAATTSVALSSESAVAVAAQPDPDALVEDPNLTLSRGGALSPGRAAPAAAAAAAAARRASLVITASAVALAGRAVPLAGVAGEVLREGALHVLVMSQHGVVTRAPAPPGVQAANGDDDNDGASTASTAASQSSAAESDAEKPAPGAKQRASMLLSASSSQSVGITARKLEAQTRHWCVIDDNSGFGARLSIGALEDTSKAKKQANARIFKARGWLYLRDATVQATGHSLRITAAGDGDGDHDASHIESLTLTAEDELDAAEWRDALVRHGAHVVDDADADADADDDEHARARSSDSAVAALASAQAATTPTSGGSLPRAPGVPAPVPAPGTSASLKKAKSSKKQREMCHQCNARRVAARVFIDGLHVLLCRECTLAAMHSYNTTRDAGPATANDDDNDE